MEMLYTLSKWVLKNVDKTKCLGIMIIDYLCWIPQVEYFTGKVNNTWPTKKIF